MEGNTHMVNRPSSAKDDKDNSSKIQMREQCLEFGQGDHKDKHIFTRVRVKPRKRQPDAIAEEPSAKNLLNKRPRSESASNDIGHVDDMEKKEEKYIIVDDVSDASTESDEESSIYKNTKENLQKESFIFVQVGNALLECKKCSYSTGNHSSFHIHLYTQHQQPNQERVHCNYCNENISANSNVIEPSASTFKCTICNWSTTRHFQLHMHLLTHVDNTAIKCTHCEKVISPHRPASKVKSTIQLNSGGSLKCRECDKTFPKRAELIKHKEDVHDFQPQYRSAEYVCFLCLEQFTSLLDLKGHMRIAHRPEINADPKLMAFVHDHSRRRLVDKGEEMQCSYCDWKTDRHFNYHRHVLKHCRSSQQYVCPFCCKLISPKGCSSAYGLGAHACYMCNKVCFSKYHLYTHLYQEHGAAIEGPLSCAVCGYTCKSKTCLENHHQIAHEGQAFILNDETKRHLDRYADVKVQGNNKEYRCEDCQFVCYRLDTFTKHRITHVPEQIRDVFTCSFDGCGFESYSENSLNVHVAGKHKRGKQQGARSALHVEYACDLCGRFTCDTEKLLFKHQQEDCIAKDDPDKFIRSKTHKALPGTVLKYSCVICRKFTASRRWNMRRHKESAHEHSAPFCCDQCAYTSKHARVLLNHYQKVHLADPPVELLSHVKPQKESTQQDLRRGGDVVKDNTKQIFKVVTCIICGGSVMEKQMQKHMQLNHPDGNTGQGSQLLSAAAELQPSAAGSVCQCVWGCSFSTSNTEEWHLHNKKICSMRDTSKSEEDYALLCHLQKVQSLQPRDLLASGDQLSQGDEAVTMETVSKITAAMTGDGLVDVAQDGKTIYLTVDDDKIDQVKAKLENLGNPTSSSTSSLFVPMTEGDVDVQYVIQTDNEPTASVQIPQQFSEFVKSNCELVQLSDQGQIELSENVTYFVNDGEIIVNVNQDTEKEDLSSQDFKDANQVKVKTAIATQNPITSSNTEFVVNEHVDKSQRLDSKTQLQANTEVSVDEGNTEVSVDEGAKPEQKVLTKTNASEAAIENPENLTITIEKGENSSTLHINDNSGEIRTFQIQGDLLLSEDGALSPEIMQIILSALQN